jgi:hypothetical protein
MIISFELIAIVFSFCAARIVGASPHPDNGSV